MPFCNGMDRDSRFVPRESGLTSYAGGSLREIRQTISGEKADAGNE